MLDVAAEEAMELGDDLIEVEEMADLRRGRDRRREPNMEWAVKEVAEKMLVMNLDEVEIQAEQSEDGWEVTLKGPYNANSTFVVLLYVHMRSWYVSQPTNA